MAIVDDADFEWLSQWKWYAQVNPCGGFYAARRGPNQALRRGPLIYMHRLINATPEGLLTDHRDGDGLNNQRTNLRDATCLQNQMNRRAKKRGLSSLKGVSFSAGGKRIKRWTAVIRLNGKPNFLGRYATEQEAAAAYATAARIHFGEFANIQSGGLHT